MVFPEALADAREFAAVRAAVDVPLLANMTEFGKSRAARPRASSRTSASTSSSTRSPPLRLAMGAVEDGARAIARDGHPGGPGAAHADARPALRPARLRGLRPFDANVFNFTLTDGGTDDQTDTEIHKGLAGVVVDTTAVS